MTVELQLELLGGLRITQHGAALTTFVSGKAPALLGYLAVTGRPHFRAALAGLLWSEHAEEDARRNLRVVLNNLRKLVAPHLIITRDTVAFNGNSAYWLDVEVFLRDVEASTVTPDLSRLRAAVALYQGDFLEGFYVRDAPVFDEWAMGLRERLRHLALQALHTLAVHATERREYAAGIDYLTRLLTIDPWREEAHRQVMEMLARSGQRAAALAQYETCYRMLRDELGVEPEDETTALYEQIRAGAIAVQLPLPAPLNTLPMPLTSLLGRPSEVAQITSLLKNPTCRLVTLVGPGGIGKTHLALQVASDLRDHFRDGVFFVSLASISDPGLLGTAIAHVFDVQEAGGRSLLDSLKQYLHDKQLLLLLDNFEHLLSAAPLVAELLTACPRLKVLVTSRAVLHLRGEQECEVLPLALPPRGLLPTKEVLTQYAALALFVERAHASKPEFTISSTTAAAVAEICQRLEGLPLAIELAAARVKFMSLQALLARLEQRLAILTDGARDLPDRQQTLRSTISWSYDLLEPGMQLLFARLGVFAGGWTMEAAEAVCTTPSAVHVMDGVASLLNNSLVRRVEQPEGEVRFTMLEVIREYALERLHASGEGETIRGQHAQYYLAVVEQAESELHGPQETEWLLRLDEETDNIRAALQWALDSSCADLGFRMAGALRWYWQLRGRLSEGRTWLEALMSAERKAGSLVLESVRAKALTTEGILTLAQGDLRTAETLVEASLVLARGQADRGNVADALHALGNATHARGDYQRAGGLYEEALDLYRDLGDQRAVATVLNDLGMLARDLGEWARARTRHEESLILRQALGGKSAIAHSFRNLGLVAHLAGDYEHAETRLEESLTLFQELGDVLGVADTLNHLGRLPQVRRDWRRASALFEGALVVYRELGDKRGVAWTLNNLGLIAYDQGEYARAVALHEESLAIHQALGSEDRAGISLYDLGNALHAVGDTRRAREAYAAAVSLLWTAGDKALLAFGIEGLARVALSEGQPKHMVRLCGAADALRVAIEAPLPPPDRPLYERTLAEAHRLLGEEEFAQAWSEGRTMTLEQAIAYALEGLGNVSEGGKP